MVDCEDIPIIFDIGSDTTKIGFGDDDLPRSYFPTIVGRRKWVGGVMVGDNSPDDYWVGDEAIARRGILRLKHPVERGLVEDFREYEKLLHESFYTELRCDGWELLVLLTEHPWNVNSKREKALSIFFEKFEVLGFFMAACEALALYSTGRLTGVVVDCGADSSSCVPVYEGHVVQSVPFLQMRIPSGGKHVTDVLIQMLNDRGYEMTTTAERAIVEDIKRTLCRVSLEFEDEMIREEAVGMAHEDYELPDGSKLPLGSERIRAPEVLFAPSLGEVDLPGIHKSLVSCVQSCDLELQAALFQNVVLSGGCTKLEGFAERLRKEIHALVPDTVAQVDASEDRQFLAWKGGQVMSSLSSMRKTWISKQEFEEAGASVVHRKCF